TQRHWFTQPRTSTTRAFIMANTLIKLVAVAAERAAQRIVQVAAREGRHRNGGAQGRDRDEFDQCVRHDERSCC
ncbi:hypothetical protein QZM99_34825, partial [Burkholderia gladioli]|uniref:hypothetical protein n=1 Tax=Burkholderia gladioli TaxID=28095 RepID=UPI00264D794E